MGCHVTQLPSCWAVISGQICPAHPPLKVLPCIWFYGHKDTTRLVCRGTRQIGCLHSGYREREEASRQDEGAYRSGKVRRRHALQEGCGGHGEYGSNVRGVFLPRGIRSHCLWFWAVGSGGDSSIRPSDLRAVWQRKLFTYNFFPLCLPGAHIYAVQVVPPPAVISGHQTQLICASHGTLHGTMWEIMLPVCQRGSLDSCRVTLTSLNISQMLTSLLWRVSGPYFHLYLVFVLSVICALMSFIPSGSFKLLLHLMDFRKSRHVFHVYFSYFADVVVDAILLFVIPSSNSVSTTPSVMHCPVFDSFVLTSLFSDFSWMTSLNSIHTFSGSLWNRPSIWNVFIIPRSFLGSCMALLFHFSFTWIFHISCSWSVTQSPTGHIFAIWIGIFHRLSPRMRSVWFLRGPCGAVQV